MLHRKPNWNVSKFKIYSPFTTTFNISRHSKQDTTPHNSHWRRNWNGGAIVFHDLLNFLPMGLQKTFFTKPLLRPRKILLQKSFTQILESERGLVSLKSPCDDIANRVSHSDGKTFEVILKRFVLIHVLLCTSWHRNEINFI